MITYWNFTDIEKHTGVSSVALRQRQFRGTMPPADATIGSMQGWLPATIETWWGGKERAAAAAAAEDLLTPAQAAILLKRSESSLAQYRATGVGPKFQKLGNLVRYSKADIDAWLEGGKGA